MSFNAGKQHPMQRIVRTHLIIILAGILTLSDMAEQFGHIYDMCVVEGTAGVLFDLQGLHNQYMSYWDINHFLAEEEPIEFCFRTDAYFMDFLDSTKEGVIPQGQTINTPIWLVNTIYDYLEIGDTEADLIKVAIPSDFHIKSLDRINSFRSSHRSTVEKVRIKSQMPYFYEIYEAIKKITQHHQGTKFQGQKIADFLEERGKLIISRAMSIFEQCRADPITNNYTKFQMDLYKTTREKSLQYEKWKTS